MYRITAILLATFIYSAALAQIFPNEGDKLNYRIVGFSWPEISSRGGFLEIARGTFYSDSGFRGNIIFHQDVMGKRITAEVPAFGSSYTWRVVNAGEPSLQAVFHHFTTGVCPAVDSQLTRLRILTPASSRRDGFVLTDGNRVMYDMNGNPVWYLPEIAGVTDGKRPIRDMKLSPFGTITFMAGQNAEEDIFEVNYDGEVLWSGPNDGAVSGDTSEHYHHVFTRLGNGHYMVLGTEMLLRKRDTGSGTSATAFIRPGEVSSDNAKHYDPVAMGTIMEYDKNGKLLWHWKYSNCLSKADIAQYLTSSDVVGMHENAFYFDENTKNIYVSFRNVNSIFRVHYPDGEVTGVFGKMNREAGEQLFCHQHCCVKSAKGDLYVYNNNFCNPGQASTIIKFEEPKSLSGNVRKLWEYQCTIEDEHGDKKRGFFGSGGNVEELADGNIFVNMSGIYSKVFIVSEDKNVLWSALPEKWNSTSNSWEIVPQYKANFINGKEALQALIYNGRAKSKQTPSLPKAAVFYQEKPKRQQKG
jgi:hypothetical protein